MDNLQSPSLSRFLHYGKDVSLKNSGSQSISLIRARSDMSDEFALVELNISKFRWIRHNAPNPSFYVKFRVASFLRNSKRSDTFQEINAWPAYFLQGYQLVMFYMKKKPTRR